MSLTIVFLSFLNSFYISFHHIPFWSINYLNPVVSKGVGGANQAAMDLSSVMEEGK